MCLMCEVHFYSVTLKLVCFFALVEFVPLSEQQYAAYVAMACMHLIRAVS